MAVGLLGSDEYTEAYRWGESQERDGTAEEVAAAVAAELDERFPRIDWRATVETLRSRSAL
jgi:hypothetical protein